MEADRVEIRLDKNITVPSSVRNASINGLKKQTVAVRSGKQEGTRTCLVSGAAKIKRAAEEERTQQQSSR